jgi:myo-inositol-1(or 4)-monophosphatase
VAKTWGRPESRVVQGQGAGGDGTVFIDSLAEALVVGRLERAHREGLEFDLISEELGERRYGGGGDVVVVDPIDGSHNAKMGIPYFSLVLAAGHGRKFGDVDYAVVRNLVTGDHYEARRGGGATLNGNPIRGAEGDDFNVVQLEPNHLLEILPRFAGVVQRAQKVRALGSAALNICLCASGAISVSMAPTLRSVDCAGPLLVLEEAGGAASDLTGDSVHGLDMALDNRTSLMTAANPGLLAAALTLLRPEDEELEDWEHS